MRSCKSTSVVPQGVAFPRASELTFPMAEFAPKSLVFHNAAQTALDKLHSDPGRHWKMQPHSQEKESVRTSIGLLKGNTLKAMSSSKEMLTISWDEFRKLKQRASGWESCKFSSVVTKNVKMRLSGFSGLELLNISPPLEQVLPGFTAAHSCSPTVGADMPISAQWCQAQIPL